MEPRELKLLGMDIAEIRQQIDPIMLDRLRHAGLGSTADQLEQTKRLLDEAAADVTAQLRKAWGLNV